MNAGSRGRGDLRTKEERDRGQDQLSLGPSSSRRWSAFRNPRIVRVSRTFGGKDRHSKVCTVRGLRDRRIRLSVPTAVQLYDLQDRLGVNQPSKVIDWLIDATKNEIDKLPPLQMPPGFGLVSPELLGAPFFDIGSSTTSAFLKHGLTDSLRFTRNGTGINENWNVEDLMRAKGKEVENRESQNVPARFDFLPVPLPNLSHHPGSQLGFMSQSYQNPFTNASSPSSMPRIFPPYNNGTPRYPLVAENNFQLLSSGQLFSPPLHLFGPSMSRPISGEYVRLVTCPENKIPKTHRAYDDKFDGVS